MRRYLSLLTTDTPTRDYAVAGLVLTVLTLVGFHSLNAFIESMRQSVRVETARLDRTGDSIRNYTITRSVLDDNVATGSIAGARPRPVVLDPCTGQIKSK